MNDEMSSNDKVENDEVKNDQVKPAIFYAQKSKDEKSKHSENRRDGRKSKSVWQSDYSDYKSGNRKSSSNRPDNRHKPNSHNSTYHKSKTHSHSDRLNDSRIEVFKPRGKNTHSNQINSNQINSNNTVKREDDSPWKNHFSKDQRLTTFSRDDSRETKPIVDQELLRRQRREETLIYSENSCKAVFVNRPDSIVKAFFLQEKTHEFKPLIAWLVQHRLGYDVIDDEKLTKIAQTPHHGGVCLIVKKRQALTVQEYLSEQTYSSKDYVLAIDDVNNPHNLGGIARTAAFFNVNGLLLKQPDLLDNSAALRVAEGGVEYLMPIKADDFIEALGKFKHSGYQVVALLPYRINSLKAVDLAKVRFKEKTVFIILQRADSEQTNTKLAEFADKIVYLPSSGKAMPSLNISVLTGVLLAKIANDSSK